MGLVSCRAPFTVRGGREAQRSRFAGLIASLLCARLWGGDPAKLELQVRARFGPEDCDAMQAGRPQKPNASPYFELMLSACKTDVPFTLP